MYFIPVRCNGSIFHLIFIFCYISYSFQIMKLDLTDLIGELSFLRVCACPWQIQTCTMRPRQTLTHPWPHGKCSKGELWVPWEDRVICPTAGVLSASCILASFCSSKKNTLWIHEWLVILFYNNIKVLFIIKKASTSTLLKHNIPHKDF